MSESSSMAEQWEGEDVAWSQRVPTGSTAEWSVVRVAEATAGAPDPSPDAAAKACGGQALPYSRRASLRAPPVQDVEGLCQGHGLAKGDGAACMR